MTTNVEQPIFPAVIEAENISDLSDLPRMKVGIANDARADNTARASFAAHALVAYAKHAGEEGFSDQVGDMLCDLMHLCDALSVDFDDELSRAQNNHKSELRGGRL